MPIYEYVCKDCNGKFEKLESISNEAHECKCTFCGGVAVRAISESSFHLTGGGWYTTDYKNKPAAACPSAKENSAACSCCPAAKVD